MIIIDIQKKTSHITEFEHIFAISLSESEILDFWEQNHLRKYDPICDLVIRINNIYFIIEAKRDNFNCTAQLFNQIINIPDIKSSTLEFNKENYEDLITPIDLNWHKLMSVAVKVFSFEKSSGNQNRFLADFVDLVKSHNYRWVPEASISSLRENNKTGIYRRIESAIEELSKSNDEIQKLEYADRIGFVFKKPWAQELLFSIGENGGLIVAIYPGNTKAQGYHIFNGNYDFVTEINIANSVYKLEKSYHIKFTSFHKYFTGLWFNDKDLQKDLLTLPNFYNYTGRNKRGNDWKNIESLFDESFNFDWRSKCNWKELVIDSGKSQFDISFGYEITLEIPFVVLKKIDTTNSDISDLISLLNQIYDAFTNELLIEIG